MQASIHLEDLVFPEIKSGIKLLHICKISNED